MENFWNKVNKNSNVFGATGSFPSECWEWIGALRDGHYGCIGFKNKVQRSHRVSWILHFGDIPDDLCVCHACDNTKCIRPDHLFLGTISDNMKDAYNKGRIKMPKRKHNGMQRHNAKLTDDIVRTIRKDYLDKKETYRSLAAKYHVDIKTIGHVIHYRKWKHVK